VRGPSVWGQHRQRGALVEISPESRVPAASRPRRKELGYSRSVAFASKPLLVSSAPSFGRPPCMKLLAFWRIGYSAAAVGREVDFSMVRKSPFVSWTRGASITPIGATGR
jgi:hypothetical protein